MKTPTLYEIIRNNIKCIIHTPTIQEAKLLCNILYSLNQNKADFYISLWNRYKEQHCYRIVHGCIDGFDQRKCYEANIKAYGEIPIYNFTDIYSLNKDNDINNIRMTFTTTSGNRRYRNQLIPIVTTTVYDSKTGKSGSATCDEADYNERDGILNAIANMVFGNFDKEYKKTKKAMKRAHEIDCTCKTCGEKCDTPDHARACEEAHIERKKAKRENYLLRKEARDRVAKAEREGKIAQLMAELIAKKKGE